MNLRQLLFLFPAFIFLTVCSKTVLLAQSAMDKKAKEEKITIPNGSFEDLPKDGRIPSRWKACGANSTPDILPGPWGVTNPPSHGNSYLGLITREDNTFEAVTVKLEKAMKKDQCYTFNVDLAHSAAYSGYAKTGCLRVWGGNSPCERKQLLAVSGVIEHYEWKTYGFSFFAKDEYKYITIECYYKMPSLIPYRANILIDTFFSLEICDRA
jgi:hypothetical protein